MKKIIVLLAAIIIIQAAFIAHLAHYNKNLVIRNNNQFETIEKLKRG